MRSRRPSPGSPRKGPDRPSPVTPTLLAASVLLAAACGGPSGPDVQQARAVVHGQVTDPDSGGVADAEVVVLPLASTCEPGDALQGGAAPPDTTDPAGAYRVTLTRDILPDRMTICLEVSAVPPEGSGLEEGFDRGAQVELRATASASSLDSARVDLRLQSIEQAPESRSP